VPLEAWFTAAVVTAMIGTLVFTRVTADMVFFTGLAVLLLSGVITPGEALHGFSNQGMITVALLYVVVAGIRETGGIQFIVQNLLGAPRSLAHAQVKLALPVTGMSAFLNNTPVVAMLIPAVKDWGNKFNLPVSRLMIPLSYAAILGGTCTLIGTSTNLVVNGMLIDRSGEAGLGMFDLAWVGIPVAVIGLIFIVATTRWLLPDRRPPMSQMDDPREYSVEMLVAEDGPLAGKSIEEAGLRHLSGTYLAEIERDGTVLPAVSPQEVLRGGDRLMFVGIVDSVVELQKIRGLVPATNQVSKLALPRSQRSMIEAVVSDTCPIVGKTIRDGQFRTHYGAVVIAVARNGERLNQKIGDIVLRAGDTLLLEARPSFTEEHRNSRDFFLVSQLEDAAPPSHERALLSGGILLAMVGSVTLGWLSMLEAAMGAAGLMLVSRCCSIDTARRSIDWSVLLVIAAAFGIGAAMETTGLAATTAKSIVDIAGDAPLANLVAIYVATALFTAVITNNAAALLMFPIAWAVAGDLGVSVMPFIIAIMFAASASFATPIGYQTNLMVYGPGGYRFTDYLRIGLPMNLLTGAIAILLIPLVWAF